MIGILTYSKPHKKTQDLCFRLKSIYPDEQFVLIPMPWIEREHNPVLKHRSDNALPLDAIRLGSLLNIQLIPEMEFIKMDYDLEMFLIGGANILMGDFEKNKVINTHPGYLPNYRGLDAYKWAVYEGGPVGVTTYIINSKTDCGILIDRKIIGYENFYKTATDVYNLEIKMLVDSIHFVRKNPTGENLTEEFPLYRRMDLKTEYELKAKI